MPKIIIKGSWMQNYLEEAAKSLGIELVAMPANLSQQEEIDFVNTTPEVIAYLYFASWGGDYYKHIALMTPPKIFWNLEDPNHFDTFYKQAEPADIVITTAGELLNTYQQIYPDKRVDVLPWACEPKFHYPNVEDVEFKNRTYDLVFVGNRYPDQIDRVIGEHDVFLPALAWARERGKTFAVFGIGDQSIHSWRHVQEVWVDSKGRAPFGAFDFECKTRNPEYVGVYQSYTNSLVAGDIYRQSTVVICVNEQRNSPTMCSMRTFEACGCGNIVVSHDSWATRNLFQGVWLSNSPSETVAILDEIFFGDPGFVPSRQAQLMAGKALRHVYEHHTYAHRLMKLLEML